MNNQLYKLKFEYLNKTDFCYMSKDLFSVLADNMTAIAPTGNSREKDFGLWYDAVKDSLKSEERQIIIIKDNKNFVGYFQYCINENTFMMEEIQLKSEYQGKGVFRKLYSFVLDNIKNDPEFVEAYSNINNSKSIGILEKFGLSNIGLNKNGRSYHFKGKFIDLIKWYKNK